MKTTVNTINWICYITMVLTISFSLWQHNLISAIYQAIILFLMVLWHIELGKNKTTNIYSPNIEIKINKEE